MGITFSTNSQGRESLSVLCLRFTRWKPFSKKLILFKKLCICTCGIICSLRPEEGIWYPPAGVTGAVSCRTWILNSSPLQELYVLLTTEPSFPLRVLTGRDPKATQRDQSLDWESILVAGHCLERNTSHRAALNAYYREFLKTKNTHTQNPHYILVGNCRGKQAVLQESRIWS